MADVLEHVAMLQRLDPDHVDDYVEAHQDVPETVTEVMAANGVHRFRLWVRDEITVGYIEIEDWDAFTERYMADPDCVAWEERVGAFKRSGVDVETGELPIMDEVWSFEPDA